MALRVDHVPHRQGEPHFENTQTKRRHASRSPAIARFGAETRALGFEPDFLEDPFPAYRKLKNHFLDCGFPLRCLAFDNAMNALITERLPIYSRKVREQIVNLSF